MASDGHHDDDDAVCDAHHGEVGDGHHEGDAVGDAHHGVVCDGHYEDGAVGDAHRGVVVDVATGSDCIHLDRGGLEPGGIIVLINVQWHSHNYHHSYHPCHHETLNRTI